MHCVCSIKLDMRCLDVLLGSLLYRRVAWWPSMKSHPQEQMLLLLLLLWTTIIPALTGGTKQLDGLWLHTVRGNREVPDKNSSTGAGTLKEFWRCNHCGGEFSGLSITRVKIHLSGEGKGIAVCIKVSNTANNIYIYMWAGALLLVYAALYCILLPCFCLVCCVWWLAA